MDSRHAYSSRVRRRVTGCTLLLCLTACTVGPDYEPPDLALPDGFRATTNPVAGELPSQPVVVPPAVNLARWWNTFGDQTLNTLVERAIAANLDVKIARARVREARAQLEITEGELFPTLFQSLSYNRSRSSTNSKNSSSSESNSGSEGSGESASNRDGELYTAGFDATWELDIFGGIRRSIEASDAGLAAEEEGLRDTLVSLLAEVAQNYILLRASQDQLRIAEKNVDAQSSTLDIQRTKLEAGIASDLTVAQVEALVASTKAQVPTLQTQIQQAIHRLSLLLALPPTALEQELAPPKELPLGPQVIPPGLPSALVRRRPDIRRAERMLAAATANIGVAVAELFPKFNLTGALGLKSKNGSNLFEGSSGFWSFNSAIDMPFPFDRRIWSNIEVNNARQEQALLSYRQTVLRALADVEDGLVAYNREQARYELLEASVASNRRAFDLAQQLNEAGVVDFLNVLNAEQSLYQAEDQMARSRQTVSTGLVILYKALGGGWEE